MLPVLFYLSITLPLLALEYYENYDSINLFLSAILVPPIDYPSNILSNCFECIAIIIY